MLLTVLFQPRDGGFDRDCPVSPEPALIFARQTLRPEALGIAFHDRVYAVLEHEHPPCVGLAGRNTGLRLARLALVLIDDDLDSQFLKLHGWPPFTLFFPSFLAMIASSMAAFIA